MSTDGKQLEGLVRFVEQLQLPPNFEIKTNERVYNDEGIQIAEFDIEIRGKVGTTEFWWLIECRDRPSQGPAPGAWIEQLVGRRTRFGFNKVTAVSTSGFAAGAVEFAEEQGIELREVSSLDPTEFVGWLGVCTVRHVRRISEVKKVSLKVASDESEERRNAAIEMVKNSDGADGLLVSILSGNVVPANLAFLAAIQKLPEAFANMKASSRRLAKIEAKYPLEDHFILRTNIGDVRISTIVFEGELRLEEEEFPVAKIFEYRQVETGETISRVATFEPQKVEGRDLIIEFHQLPGSEDAHFSVRLLPDAKSTKREDR